MSTVKKNLPPHPGDVLGDRLVELGVSPYRFGQSSGAKAVSAYSLIRAQSKFGTRTRRNLTAQMALRLARFFGDDPQYWLKLQADYDLAIALSDKGFAKELEAIQPYSPDQAGDMLTGDVPPPKARSAVKKGAAKKATVKKAAVKKSPIKSATKKAAKAKR